MKYFDDPASCFGGEDDQGLVYAYMQNGRLFSFMGEFSPDGKLTHLFVPTNEDMLLERIDGYMRVFDFFRDNREEFMKLSQRVDNKEAFREELDFLISLSDALGRGIHHTLMLTSEFYKTMHLMGGHKRL